MKQTRRYINENNYVAFKYVDKDGNEGGFPVNPNGSTDAIAGLTDATGRVLGLMPHPERFVRITPASALDAAAKDNRDGDGTAYLQTPLNTPPRICKDVTFNVQLPTSNVQVRKRPEARYLHPASKLSVERSTLDVNLLAAKSSLNACQAPACMIVLPDLRGLSSVGRALAWHARGRAFDSRRLHLTLSSIRFACCES